MRVHSAEFVKSATEAKGWPAEGPPEIAFVGRSNVGKSSLLGALMGRKGLVRVSSTPGRTRLINFFDLQVSARKGVDPWPIRFVDLPGFGYAKVSKAERASWRPFIQEYLEARKSLVGCVLLVDARRGAEIDEQELSHFMTDHGKRVIPVLTKSDKLSKHERVPVADKTKKALGHAPEIVSATEGMGLDSLWERLFVALGPPRR